VGLRDALITKLQNYRSLFAKEAFVAAAFRGVIMLRNIAFTVALTLAGVTAGSAQGQGDAKERAACRPGVMRFFKQFVKDNNNEDVVSILNCLESNRSRISKVCSEVLSSHGQYASPAKLAGHASNDPAARAARQPDLTSNISVRFESIDDVKGMVLQSNFGSCGCTISASM
jgi:hypothetical protein